MALVSPCTILSGMALRDYNEPMNTWFCIMTIAAVLWVVLVIGVGLHIWLRVMPAVRELRKTKEGQAALVKLVFPPRFPRN